MRLLARDNINRKLSSQKKENKKTELVLKSELININFELNGHLKRKHAKSMSLLVNDVTDFEMTTNFIHLVNKVIDGKRYVYHPICRNIYLSTQTNNR